MIIDGRKIANEILERLKLRPKPSGFFGAVLVGNDAASLNFLKQKEKVARELGIEFRLYELSADLTTDDLRREIARFASPKSCGGFILQLPLPEGVNRHYVLNAIPKEKDADFLSETALGAFYTGRSKIVPPSVGTVEEILEFIGKPSNVSHRNLRDLKIVLLGAGFLIGKPVGFWLQNRVAELTVLDASVKNVHERLRDADIVISGAGQPNLFSAKDLKDGAIVIDFGFSKLHGKITGDFDPSANPARPLIMLDGDQLPVSYTPTPGGTGPILVAKLFENFFRLNE